MDSPAPMDEWPQIGRTDVEPGSLDGPGMVLTDLAAELDIVLDESTVGDGPAEGWRVVRRYPAGATLFAAPADADRRFWRVGSATPGASDTVHVSPEPEKLRPSRAERRRGLTLRWAPHMFDTPAPEDFVVDIVNTGDTTWWPDGDSFHVVGVFTEPGQSEFSFGWASIHRNGGVPLQPGEYARVRVDINSGTWTELEPGTYDLRAVLVDLGVQAEQPLTVTVTRELIEARRPPHRPHPTGRDQRRMIESELARLRAMALALDSLDTVFSVIANPQPGESPAAALATALECDEEAALVILASSLNSLTGGNRDAVHAQMSSFERRLTAL